MSKKPQTAKQLTTEQLEQAVGGEDRKFYIDFGSEKREYTPGLEAELMEYFKHNPFV